MVASKHLRLAAETEEERRVKLETDSATKRLSLAIEMDEERKARLEKMVATKRLRLAMETDKERMKSKTGEDGSHHTAQVGPGDRGRKKVKKEWI